MHSLFLYVKICQPTFRVLLLCTYKEGSKKKTFHTGNIATIKIYLTEEQKIKKEICILVVMATVQYSQFLIQRGALVNLVFMSG